MKINVLGIVKGVTGLVASAGAGVVVGNLVRATTPDDLSKAHKILAVVGSYTIGNVLGDLSAKYVNEQIDEIAQRISDIIRPSEETQNAVEEAAEAIITTDTPKPKKDDKSAKSE